ncbi:hypothetical protein [Parageobacillus galactosidasius]|uniref:Transposase n=1 Tax=Parageobacillus galactosidasius TaxID=883812 RepID=A0A226QM61_9BACL|nr:hypothetical protein [Parageobacillus galactosidasius]OXB93623.1 hypothetical protein B9L23_01180 [Parageobacillus galactosidasius]
MLCTLKIKLMPTLEQFHALLETMKRFNQACNYISEIAFRSRTFSKTKIQRLCLAWQGMRVRKRLRMKFKKMVR